MRNAGIPARDRRRETPPPRPERTDWFEQGEAAVRLTGLYSEAFSYVGSVLSAAGQQQPFAVEKAFEIVEKMAAFTGDPAADPLFLRAIYQDSLKDYHIYHIVNSAVFSIKLAQQLQWDHRHQVKVGAAALLHGAGIGLIPEELIYKEAALSHREMAAIRRFPIHGYRLLKEHGKDHEWLAETVLQVNERLDGSGYPNGLKGDEINPYAQVVGSMAAYDAMIHSRPHRSKMLYSTAAKEILRIGKTTFQKAYLRAFIRLFTFFPPYSFVRLNTNALGRVIGIYAHNPLKPKVEIIYDAQHRTPPTPEVIDLPRHPLLYVADSVSEQDLSNAARLMAGQYRLPGDGKTAE